MARRLPVELEIGTQETTDTVPALAEIRWLSVSDRASVALVTEDGLVIRFHLPATALLRPGGPNDEQG